MLAGLLVVRQEQLQKLIVSVELFPCVVQIVHNYPADLWKICDG